MNPFLWRGPEFLLFYLVLAIAVLIWQAIRKSQRQSANRTQNQNNNNRWNVSDPYEVAYLRLGPEGAIRVAVVRLLDEGLLVEFAPGKIRRAASGPGAVHLAPVERAVYDYCRLERRAAEIPGAWPVKSELAAPFDAYRNRLDSNGLLVGPRTRSGHVADWIYCSAGLIAVAGIKILYALANGHRNIWFLVVLAMLSFVASCIIAYSGRVTAEGKKTIANLRKLAQPGAAVTGFHARGGELAMAAALFGFAALPSLAGDQYRKLYGGAEGAGDGSLVSYSSSCGSSSSSCSSGGSSCGGGGGGCGGCGGGGGD